MVQQQSTPSSTGTADDCFPTRHRIRSHVEGRKGKLATEWRAYIIDEPAQVTIKPCHHAEQSSAPQNSSCSYHNSRTSDT
jgi:hypothetical protein